MVEKVADIDTGYKIVKGNWGDNDYETNSKAPIYTDWSTTLPIKTGFSEIYHLFIQVEITDQHNDNICIAYVKNGERIWLGSSSSSGNAQYNQFYVEITDFSTTSMSIQFKNPKGVKCGYYLIGYYAIGK